LGAGVETKKKGHGKLLCLGVVRRAAVECQGKPARKLLRGENL
jgi:hypothetical protein